MQAGHIMVPELDVTLHPQTSDLDPPQDPGVFLARRCGAQAAPRVLPQEASKLWCLCKLPYNEERPMLACDYCQDWFHYDCVGLRPPGDDEDDEDVAPPDFRCPSCCLKAWPQQ